MIRFEDLIEKVRASNPDADTELLRRAYVFSAFEHKGQLRHSGEPYLVHPLEENAGGDFYHSGGKHFMSQNDPEWQTLKAFVMGQILGSTK